MSIPTVTSNPEQFLESLLEYVQTIQESDDSIEFSISTLHRKDAQDETVIPAVLEFKASVDYSTDNADAVQLMTPVTYDQYTAIMDRIITDLSPHASVNRFAVEQMQRTILSVFEREYDDEQNQKDALEHLFNKAIYQGLACKLSVDFINGHLTISFAISAELYADTSEQESEILKEKGLNPAAVSDPNKMVLIFEQTIHSYHSIL